MTNQKPRKAIIYCRVSSRSQLKGDGLNSQEFRCREHAEKQGYEVEAVFPDSVSGKGDFMARPGMVALLSYLDAQKGEPYAVIFDDLKRFARDIEFHWTLRRTLKERNAVPECLNYQFEETPEGRFVETIFAAQGALDREQNARQSRQKSEARLRQGYWVFQKPIGYKYVPSKGGGKIIVRDEPLASIIENALKGYASGHFRSIAEIERHLSGIPEFPKNTAAGNVRSQTVIRILENPFYAGKIDAKCWGIKAEGKHEPLIDLETHKRIKQRMKARSFTKARADTNEDFPLRGSVSCASCGNLLTGGWAKGKCRHYPYYWCSNKDCEMKSKTIPRDKIEGEFADILNTLVPSETMVTILREMFRIRWDQKTQDIDSQRAKFLKEAESKESEIGALVERIVQTSNARVAEAFEKRIEELQDEKTILTQKASKVGTPAMSFDELFEHSLRFLSEPKKLWNSGSLALKRLLTRLSFTEAVRYARGHGFEHPAYSGVFNIINELGGKMSQKSLNFDPACKMVPRR